MMFSGISTPRSRCGQSVILSTQITDNTDRIVLIFFLKRKGAGEGWSTASRSQIWSLLRRGNSFWNGGGINLYKIEKFKLVQSSMKDGIVGNSLFLRCNLHRPFFVSDFALCIIFPWWFPIFPFFSYSFSFPLLSPPLNIFKLLGVKRYCLINRPLEILSVYGQYH
jgi:hypothetical protein